MTEIMLTKRVKYAGDVFKELIEKAGFPIDLAADFVNNIPDADAVPVVRCRECKHARDLPNKSFIACIMWSRAFHSDGFCYMGARMDAKDMDVPTKDGGAEG